ncbi:hypothetical protein KCP69_23270 [Salmonella enterica subsp. enterica]|nr:hypothetical protein KCP69_23270 [Salmonella enterica subsp. enterica]
MYWKASRLVPASYPDGPTPLSQWARSTAGRPRDGAGALKCDMCDGHAVLPALLASAALRPVIDACVFFTWWFAGWH